ncbi:hypothetical protein DYI37_17585 [Fulvimarina endophytica]|uniref:Uncharacterized protein n=1 Tax=Fulvimarina endophytica TaxID=2293836 RepID=A0A371WYK1_9HYPH|nr:hypothetical protein DYI37_17585 [Fulvimarina endophytica]
MRGPRMAASPCAARFRSIARTALRWVVETERHADAASARMPDFWPRNRGRWPDQAAEAIFWALAIAWSIEPTM